MGQKKKQYEWTKAHSYLCCTNIGLLLGAIVLFVLQLTMKNNITDTQINVLSQIRNDWEAVPFVDISVTDDWNCPQGYTEVFTRIWYGLQSGCDCLDVCTPAQSENQKCGPRSYKFSVGVPCADPVSSYWFTGSNDFKKRGIDQGCLQVEPWPTLRQSQFGGKRVCGKTGGDPFASVIRPDHSTGKCPTGTEPCLTTTIASDTLCYKADELGSKCPITDIRIVENSALDSYVQGGDYSYSYVAFNETTSVIFSKEVPQLPPSTIKVEGGEPCMDSLQQSTTTGKNQTFYPAEVMNGACSLEPNTGKLTDPRYSPSGLYTTLAKVQRENLVNRILVGQPSHSNYSSTETYPIQSWNRPTLNWDLSCEQDGFTREWALERVEISISRSDKLDTLRKTSISLISLTGAFLLGMPCMLTYCTEKMAQLPAFQYLYLRIVVIVVGVFALMSTLDGLSVNAENSDKVADLERVADCMDEYTAVSSETIKDELSSKKINLTFQLVIWLIFFLQILVELVGAVVQKCCKCERKHIERRTAEPQTELASAEKGLNRD